MTDEWAAPIPSTRRRLTSPRPDAQPWQFRASTQLLCFLGLLVPLAAVALWVYLSQDGGVTLRGMFLGPMLGGGTLIFWILFLHLIVCGDGLSALGFRRSSLGRDVMLGLVLAAATLALHVVIAAAAPRFVASRPASPQVLELISGVARDPWLLALWLGPVVWIGVALFEELARVFLLRRLWLAWPGATAVWGGIAIVSAVTGLVHAYQGPAAVVSIGLQSVLLGWVYYRTGGIYALIVSHGLYDSVQIAIAVTMVRHA